MAERSFKKEVQQLRIPAGEEFRGEGILAITKALLQSGVGYVGGYQGSPISHLMDVLADANEILEELDVHFETSASEATAAAMLAASVMYPIRGAVTWKSTVGTNVASDALANLASGGVTGGALIIIGEDYGEGSSIMQERSHAFAMKSQMWLLDPRPNLESIVQSVEDGFELSEASNTPVMLQVRIRSCHVHGRFITKENKRPRYTLKQALENPVRDTTRIVLPPASFTHEHEKIQQRWPAAVKFIREKKLNEFFDGDYKDIGLILQGGLYNGVIRALQLLGLADSYGNSRIPMYVMNVTYPVIDEEVIEFCNGKRAVLLLEEGQPDYIEQNLHAILRKAGVTTHLSGKDVLPMAGEYTTAAMKTGLEAFLKTWQADCLATHEAVAADEVAATAVATMEAAAPKAKPAAVPITFHPKVKDLANVVPARPAGFCVGCPERPIFAAMKLAQQDLGPHHVSCDIGCHLFSILPPFNLGATTMGYGLGAASSSAFNVKTGKRSISVMGDGGFWHNGLTSGIANAVFNKNDGVIVIVDNYYSSATGGQDIPSSRADNPDRSTKNPIEHAIRGAGVKWVRTIDRTYDVARVRDTLEEALTTTTDGPKVIIAQSECMLNKQRRIKPLFTKAVKSGQRAVKERFGVDADVCTGDHACIRLSGCPSLSVKDSGDPLKEDPVAHVDSGCVGCGNCGEVAEAAVLCPSFYRADIIHNPTGGDRFMAKIRKAVIGFLQRRRAERQARFAL
ncbi:indolepyruvate ferredoxin oxidoreductase subunit alpha [Parazoarcus communis]|uniref:Indolepyruvate ferredoxin oxidoreductase n=1 Tax=Parazoarcus communis SWub3 = DSM 12120 TaxID=1121029 RepID=A0A323UPW5_9RHOO|nr:indolepyruvate ferredoxin oxidoreductase subunit alpha [Parazoarcus communis]NMG72610.1 indolepyruvate ferredoxin oxidoreductase [Parazoarcus communis SWub3 = DSM 12120]PZA14367.1 indolepyruvate ferredoxin oxidoreductase [Azoarcus communis] [Parazoarcus communis SWub3 = DSM 12120]